jgi:hypothetical protein
MNIMEAWFEEVQEEAKRIIIELARLTTAGKAQWWKQKEHPQHLCCIVNYELFLFDTHNEKGHVDKEMGGVSLEARNQGFVWLTDLEGWNEVIDLLVQGSKNLIEDKQYHQLIRKCNEKILRDLEAIA